MRRLAGTAVDVACVQNGVRVSRNLAGAVARGRAEESMAWTLAG